MSAAAAFLRETFSHLCVRKSGLCQKFWYKYEICLLECGRPRNWPMRSCFRARRPMRGWCEEMWWRCRLLLRASLHFSFDPQPPGVNILRKLCKKNRRFEQKIAEKTPICLPNFWQIFTPDRGRPWLFWCSGGWRGHHGLLYSALAHQGRGY